MILGAISCKKNYCVNRPVKRFKEKSKASFWRRGCAGGMVLENQRAA